MYSMPYALAFIEIETGGLVPTLAVLFLNDCALLKSGSVVKVQLSVTVDSKSNSRI